MRYYTLVAIVQGRPVKLRRSMFTSRNEAINYMFDYYEEHQLYSLEVRDEYMVGDNKHCIEYVCNFQNRFTITRNA